MSAFRIQRYIFREITVPMLLGLVVFTFVLLMGRSLKLVELVINKGIPFGDIARLFLYLLPAFLVITIPLAFLLGVLLGFGRLSSESEVVAFKASGVDLYALAKPALLLGIFATAATGYLTLFVEPAGNSAFRTQVFKIATSRASVGLKPTIFNDDFDGLVLYTSEIEDRSGKMKGVFISDERAGDAPAAIFAKNGRIISDPVLLTLTLRLEDGSIHRRLTGKKEGAYQVIDFSSYDINLNIGQNLASGQKRIKKDNELPLTTLLETRRTAPEAARRTSATVELNKRCILALAPLLFALVAVPLGISSHRSGRGSGFSLALGVFLVYYVLLSFAKTLVVESHFPVILLWLPNLLFLMGGLTLLRFSAQERPLPLPPLPDWRRWLRRAPRPPQ
ncbi:MAG: LPS export ABC transporter permease LptF [Desulfuromonadales bacterium GWD2_61_12]|nr:MAG: LPS export ABC transporter permease LptF [Desulfuromonadales bacterium GWC2_61_20]OGR33219.1 MAG: LPS export ABC transporter permease LptF [Desulfuromonadales bacterium GWD2_61_12]HAD04708.1 LPS export ABC transporter permease LptF [Desulfuromonas sp.]HBT84082.1 LPS export ABC transporter permease LptF [Desulfuromonas sp.]